MKKVLFALVLIGMTVALFYKLPKKKEETPSPAPIEIAEMAEEEVQEITVVEDDGKHLTFKNVPIDGTLEQFVARMVQHSFKKQYQNNGNAMLKGDFAGFKDCRIIVSTIDGIDLVSSITVLFPSREKWSDLEQDYYNLKEMLTSKYGTPAKHSEHFAKDACIFDDDWKLISLNHGKCYYKSHYATGKGDIDLMIDYDEYDTYVSLTYQDKINGAAVKNHAINDL